MFDFINNDHYKKTWIEKFQSIYWKLIPYDYRPSNILYAIKCYFLRHTTIKSRYLDHKYCDAVDVLPYTIFEILSKFIEQECSPGHVDWYHEYAPKIIVNDQEKYVRDELQDLYDWWNTTYIKTYEDIYNILWAEIDKHRPISLWKDNQDGGCTYDPTFKSKEDKLIYSKLMQAINKLDCLRNIDLEDKMIRLCRLRQYLWT